MSTANIINLQYLFLAVSLYANCQVMTRPILASWYKLHNYVIVGYFIYLLTLH